MVGFCFASDALDRRMPALFAEWLKQQQLAGVWATVCGCVLQVAPQLDGEEFGIASASLCFLFACEGRFSFQCLSRHFSRGGGNFGPSYLA